MNQKFDTITLFLYIEMPKIYWSDKKNLKREIRWNHFNHDKLFRHLILLPGLVYKADHTP
jgi:hypothetical protein